MLLCLLTVAACASRPPQNVNNVCDIFYEKGGFWDNWHKGIDKASEQYGVPVSVIMATIWQESRFQAKAKPPRGRLLWVIPWKRKSSAYGFAQAKKDTWRDYEARSGNNGERDKFADAAMFVAWYHDQTHQRNGVAKTDAYRLYLAYHEGHGGYARGTWKSKPWLLEVAKKVQAREREFAGQYGGCANDLRKAWWNPL